MAEHRQYYLTTDTSAGAVAEQFSIDDAQGKLVHRVILVAPTEQSSGDGKRVARDIRQMLDRSAGPQTLTGAIQAANQAAQERSGGHRYSVLVAHIDLQTGALSYAYLGDVNAVRVTEYQTVDLLKGRRIHGYLGDDRFMAIGVGQASVERDTSSEKHGYITLQAGAQPSGSFPVASLSAVETSSQQLAHRIVRNTPRPSAAVVITKHGANRSGRRWIPIGILALLIVVLFALVSLVFLSQDGGDPPQSTPTLRTTTTPQNGTEFSKEEPPPPDAGTLVPGPAAALAPTFTPSPTTIPTAIPQPSVTDTDAFDPSATSTPPPDTNLTRTIELTEPERGITIEAGQGVPFAWSPLDGPSGGTPVEYELVFWRVGDDPQDQTRIKSPLDAGPNTEVIVNFPVLPDIVQPGPVCWGVRLKTVDDANETVILNTDTIFQAELQAPAGEPSCYFFQYSSSTDQDRLTEQSEIKQEGKPDLPQP